MDSDTRAHENENAISIFLPSIDHLLVFYSCSLRVYGEERAGAVTKVVLFLQWRRLSAVTHYSICRIGIVSRGG